MLNSTPEDTRTTTWTWGSQTPKGSDMVELFLMNIRLYELCDQWIHLWALGIQRAYRASISYSRGQRDLSLWVTRTFLMCMIAKNWRGYYWEYNISQSEIGILLYQNNGKFSPNNLICSVKRTNNSTWKKKNLMRMAIFKCSIYIHVVLTLILNTFTSKLAKQEIMFQQMKY